MGQFAHHAAIVRSALFDTMGEIACLSAHEHQALCDRYGLYRLAKDDPSNAFWKAQAGLMLKEAAVVERKLSSGLQSEAVE